MSSALCTVRCVDRIPIAAAVSWLGLWIHELHRVPAVLGLTPDGALPMLFVLVGLVGWWLPTRTFAATWALFIYATINLIGGALSTLPLGWLPFVPDQTEAHYAVHVVYAAFQLPLMTATLFATRAAIRRRGDST